jgi:hypothetical protein
LSSDTLVFGKTPLVDEVGKARGLGVAGAEALLLKAQLEYAMRHAPGRRRFEPGQQAREASGIALEEFFRNYSCCCGGIILARRCKDLTPA